MLLLLTTMLSISGYLCLGANQIGCLGIRIRLFTSVFYRFATIMRCSCYRERERGPGVQRLRLHLLLGHLVLLADQAFEAAEGRSESLEDVGRAETVARSVIGRIYGIHDYKHLLVD